MKALRFVAVLALGCSTADLKGPPPANSGQGNCGDAPQIACDAGAPSGCTGAPRSTGGGSVYPIGCRAYFQAGDCSTLSSCSCTTADGGPAWVCQP
jgi:hypothetical protein